MDMATIVKMHDAKSAAAGEHSRIPEDRKTLPWDIFKGKIKMADDFDTPLEELQSYM